ncbi:hypothetical protein D3C85_1093160 [compost metagenome]
MESDAQFAQALEPGAQQRRGLHVGGEDPARGADEGVDAQAVNPGAQGVGIEFGEQPGELLAALAVAREERRLGLGVGDIHPAHPGQEELAPDRGHGVIQLDPDPGPRQHLGRHQPGRAATDDGDARNDVLGRVGHG